MNRPFWMLIIAVLAGMVQVSDASAQAAKPAVRDTIGCSDRDMRQRIGRIALSGDQEAYKKIAAAALMSGQCHIIDKGAQLFLEDTAIWSGLACFRPAGQVSCLWMSSDTTR